MTTRQTSRTYRRPARLGDGGWRDYVLAAAMICGAIVFGLVIGIASTPMHIIIDVLGRI